jgi:DNA repair protein RecN (Recombination protein N)
VLASLFIENYALVDSMTVELGPGFTVLTGETGAGKSILIGALQLALGARADLSRSEGASIAAEFVLDPASPARDQLREFDIQPGDDRLILQRRVGKSGGTCRINGHPATATMLRTLGELLVDFHGQHEHQSLLQPRAHLRFVDAFGGDALADARAAYQTLYDERQQTLEALQGIQRDDREARRREDLLRHQLAEIDAAELTPGEEADLAAERSRLANAELLALRAGEASQALAGDDRDGSARELIAAAVSAIEELAALDSEMEPLCTDVKGALITVEEAARSLRDYAAEVELNEERLEAVEARLALIHDLKRKYGDDIQEILQYRDGIAEEIDAMENVDATLEKLTARLEALSGELREAASELTGMRRKAGRRLAERVSKRLAGLGIPEGKLEVEHEVAEDLNDYTRRGADRVQFLMRTNSGQPPLPLAKIASGGEISRTMLALKAESALDEEIPSLVFDEIDTGIGGTTSAQVGQELLALAKRTPTTQVLCVTHSPQIAALAHRQLAVAKASKSGATRIRVTPVADEDRIAELARMLGAEPGETAAFEHAEVLAREGAKARDD